METRQILGARYRLEERLGEGGMAVVWRAFDLVLGRSVAVKMPSATHATDDQFRAGILAEAQAAARVSHPHLASVHDYGESLTPDGEPVPYVVMELLNGRTLTERLATGPLTPRAGLRVCAEIASGLAAAHAANLVHQDVKPGNVMLTPTGAKLLDFGVAAIAGAVDDATDGKIMGTPNYVAPERFIGGAVVPATDVYGLGLVIFRVLTGRLPWPPGTPRLSTRAQPEPLPVIDGVSPVIGEMYLRCLALNPDDRPTAREAATILAAAVGVRPVFGDEAADGDREGDGGIPPAIGDQTTDESVPRYFASPGALAGTSAAPVVIPSERRHRAVAVAVVGVAAAAVAAALVVAFDGQSGQPPAFADAPRPTATAPPSGGGSSGASASADPEPSGGVEPRGGVVTVVGTRTVIVVPPPKTNDPPTITSSGPPSRTPSRSAPQTFTHLGNSIVAECVRGTQAHILRAAPAPGYQVRTNPGPAPTATAIFRMGIVRITMTVTCPDGVPETQITESTGS